MPFPVQTDEEGFISYEARGDILEFMQQCSACLIGPGMGHTMMTEYLVQNIVLKSEIPLILDADGINSIAVNIDALKSAKCPIILTPHEGEFARLGGDISSAGRLEGARRFAVEHQCVLVLKGHRTITALPDGTVYINTTGGPAMAKGGSGDVLAGMITALVGQHFPIKDAVIAAVYLHGLAGDICAEELGEYSVTAGDIIKAIPKAIIQTMESR
jgi:NAD(P)H-hydrate epimerase